jgi:DNA replication and repair protein RecF
MVLEQLSVMNYKNIRQVETHFSPHINFFLGKNGMGKTNLLDAIYYLSFCKSHLHTPEAHIVRKGEDTCLLQARYDAGGRPEEVLCAIRPGERKIFKRNRKEYDKLSEHIGLLPLVMISPQDTELIQGGSDSRRRFIDQVISQYDKAYLQALIDYNRALAQRNALLRAQATDEALFDAIEISLVALAQRLFERRQAFVRELVPLFADHYARICLSAETVSLHYRSSVAAGEMADMLLRNRERDRILGFTSVGVHKDDLDLHLDGRLLRRTGSQGQHKTCLIALKMAQATILAQRSNGQPILLLDDIFDKLDAERVEQIIALVGSEGFGQIFITDTNREHLDEILHTTRPPHHSLFRLTDGELYNE